MPSTSQDHHPVSLFTEAGRLVLGGLHERAGGVDHIQPASGELLDHLLRYPVGPDYHRTLCLQSRFFNQADTVLRQLRDDARVVDQGPQRVDGLVGALGGGTSGLERPLHTPAETRGLGHDDTKPAHPLSES